MIDERPVPRFFLALLVATALVLGAVLLPLAKPLFVAAVAAAVLRPLERRLSRRLRGRRFLAAGLLTLGVIALLLGPLATAITVVVRDGNDGMRYVADTARGEVVSDLVDRLPSGARDFMTDAIDRLPENLEEAMGLVGAHKEAVGTVVTATGAFFLRTGLMLIGLYLFLARGDELVAWLDSVSWLRPGQTRELLDTVKRVSYAVVASTLVTSAAQAIAALIGFYIARVPSPLFFASVTFFAAFIPAIGAAAVSLVAALLLFATGHPYLAGFLVVWAIAVVGLVDNLIKPLLIKGGMEVHAGVVFFALVGGLAAFGAIGLLVGPMAVSLFLALLRIYHRDYAPESRRTPLPGLRTPAAAGDGPDLQG